MEVRKVSESIGLAIAQLFLCAYFFSLSYFYNVTGYRFHTYIAYTDVINFTVSPFGLLLAVYFITIDGKSSKESLQDLKARIFELMAVIVFLPAGLVWMFDSRKITLENFLLYPIPLFVLLIGTLYFGDFLKKRIPKYITLFSRVFPLIIWSSMLGLMCFLYNLNVKTEILSGDKKTIIYAGVFLERGFIGLAEDKKTMHFITTSKIEKIYEFEEKSFFDFISGSSEFSQKNKPSFPSPQGTP